MAVTPLLATFRASISYNVDSLSHVMHLLANASVGGGGLSGYRFATRDASVLDTDAAVQALAALMAAILPSSNATIDTWTLSELISGAYFPVYSNVIGLTGGSALARSSLNQMTVVYRDAGRELVRNVVMGVALIAPQRSAAAGSGVFGTYFADFVNPVGNHAGNWVTGRGANYLNSATFYTVSLNRKSRRRAGLV